MTVAGTNGVCPIDRRAMRRSMCRSAADVDDDGVEHVLGQAVADCALDGAPQRSNGPSAAISTQHTSPTRASRVP